MAAPIAGCSRVTVDGKVMVLGPHSSPNDTISVDDVDDAPTLARILAGMFASLSMLLSRWYPRRTDYEDIAVSTAGAIVQLQHNFNGRVRWWVVGWVSTGTAAPVLRESSLAGSITDANTLYLQSYVSGTATVRVEEAG